MYSLYQAKLVMSSPVGGRMGEKCFPNQAARRGSSRVRAGDLADGATGEGPITVSSVTGHAAVFSRLCLAPTLILDGSASVDSRFWAGPAHSLPPGTVPVQDLDLQLDVWRRHR